MHKPLKLPSRGPPGLGIRMPKVDHLLCLDSNAPIQHRYLNRISQDLQFSMDVVEERCVYAMPYDEKYMRSAYENPPEVIVKPKKLPTPVKPKDQIPKTSSRTPKHPKCLSSETPPLYAPLPKVPNKASIEKKSPMSSSRSVEDIKRVFITAPSSKVEHLPSLTSHTGTANVIQNPNEKRISKPQWDEYVLSLLTVNMARFITFDVNKNDESEERLSRLLIDWYGEPPAMIDLTPEKTTLSVSSSTMPDVEVKPALAKLIEEGDERDQPSLPNDPYSDENQASFYRVPINLRREKTVVKEGEVETVNRTVENIHMEHRVMTPPKTMRDFLNSKVGEKCYDTDNMFEREMLTGKRPVFHVSQAGEEEGLLVLEGSNNQYVKRLVPIVPQLPQITTDTDQPRTHRQLRGMRRWLDKPEPVKESMAIGANDSARKGETTDHFERDEKDVALLLDRQANAGQSSSLIKIMEEWRQKWFLSQKFADSSVEDLVKDMKDVNPVTRIQAVVTCAKAATFVPKPSGEVKIGRVDSLKDDQPGDSDEVPLVPAVLLDSLETLLDDAHPNVRQAAAIALFTLGRHSSRAEALLRRLLSSANGNDSWAAAQCLIHAGASDADVIRVVIEHLMISEEAVVHQRAFHLLTLASAKTRLVHAMVGEIMNSSCWRHRVIACKLVPVLKGSVNKDLLHKMSELLWCDWHPEVRNCAAQAMGRCGHGRTVHDDLRQRLLTGNEAVRANAVEKLGFLGIMTTRLMPAFLQCFDNSYVSVRQNACIAAARLRISNVETLEKLVQLATYDPIWRVKAHAIKALGDIGASPENVKQCLVWAFRYEGEPAVRAEAIHALIALQCLDANVALLMRDRYLIEENALVRSELERGLSHLGIDPTEDISMVLRIRNEVQRLNRKEIIFPQIMANEKRERFESVHAALIPQQRKEEELEYEPTTEEPYESPVEDTRPLTQEEPPVVEEVFTAAELVELANISMTSKQPPSGEISTTALPKEPSSSPTSAMSVITEGAEEGLVEEDEPLEDSVSLPGRTPSASIAVERPAPLSSEDEEATSDSEEEEEQDFIDSIPSSASGKPPEDDMEVQSNRVSGEESISSTPLDSAEKEESFVWAEQEGDARSMEEDEDEEWARIKPQTDEERNVKSSNSKSRLSRAASSVRWNDDALESYPEDRQLVVSSAGPTSKFSHSTSSSTPWSEVAFPKKLQELMDRASTLETNIYQLVSESSHFRPVPIEKSGTWISLQSADSFLGPQEPSDLRGAAAFSLPLAPDLSEMPLSEHVKEGLEMVDTIEGLDLGPLIELDSK